MAIRPTFDGRSIEIGYTLDPSAWGQGYATEAVHALTERLCSNDQVTRISAILHPDNVGSAQVLERTGFQCEGHTRLSYWVGDDNSDDLLYEQYGFVPNGKIVNGEPAAVLTIEDT